MAVKINTNALLVIEKLKKYLGFSINQFKTKVGLETKSKNVNNLVINKICDIEEITEIINYSNIRIKTVSVENNRVVESMSFPAFKFKDFLSQSWEETEIYTLLKEGLIVCFFVLKDNEFVFDSVKFWIPTPGDFKEAKRIWDITKNIIISGNIVTSKDQIRKTNFPKIKDSFFVHVRPHARNAKDTYELPTPDLETGNKKYTKQSFWINASYLELIYING
jgi:DNA mismatch repair protein MutH